MALLLALLFFSRREMPAVPASTKTSGEVASTTFAANDIQSAEVARASGAPGSIFSSGLTAEYGEAKPAFEQIRDVLFDLSRLSDEEDEGKLDRLYESMQHIARSKTKEYRSFFRDVVGRVERLPVRDAFFLVKNFVLAGLPPNYGLVELLERRVQNSPNEHHTSGAARLGMVKAYTLEQLTLAANGMPRGSVTMLFPTVLELAKRDPDLLVAREAVKWILNSVPDAVSIVREVIRTRKTKERFALEDLLES